MATAEKAQCTAFAGARRIASGSLVEVAKKVKKYLDRANGDPVLIFDDDSEPVEIDFRGTATDVLDRLRAPSQPEPSEDAADARGRGRPKLGVVAREVTLLPRHWQWLSAQPGGASVALRKLVEEARRANAIKDRIRRGQEITYRFMSAVAGNLPGFEEATRALFARDPERFDRLTDPWPTDVRDHARRLAQTAF